MAFLLANCYGCIVRARLTASISGAFVLLYDTRGRARPTTSIAVDYTCNGSVIGFQTIQTSFKPSFYCVRVKLANTISSPVQRVQMINRQGQESRGKTPKDLNLRFPVSITDALQAFKPAFVVYNSGSYPVWPYQLKF